MRKLAVYINFSTPAHQARIRQLAQRLGFQADFFSQRDEAILDSIESYEVLFGYPPPRGSSNICGRGRSRTRNVFSPKGAVRTARPSPSTF